MFRHCFARWLGALSLLLLQGCAVTLDNSDVFTLRDQHVSPAEVPLEVGLDRSRVEEISVDVEARRFLGYRFVAPSTRRALIFFPGNGYGAPAALSRLARAFGDSQTDVYVLSYGQPGEQVPSVSQVFGMGQKLAALASTTSAVQPSKVFALGHSLGGWVALQLAGTSHIGCAAIVGAGTTPAETAAHLVPRPVAWFARFSPTSDVAQLDNVALARRSHMPTLVVGSEADDIMPADRSRVVFAELGAKALSALYISPVATHGGYFRDPAVLEKIHAFMRSRCDD